MTGLEGPVNPTPLVDVFTVRGRRSVGCGSKCLLIFLIFQNKFLDYEKRKVRMNPCKCFVCRMAPLFCLVSPPLPNFSAKTRG